MASMLLSLRMFLPTEYSLAKAVEYMVMSDCFSSLDSPFITVLNLGSVTITEVLNTGN